MSDQPFFFAPKLTVAKSKTMWEPKVKEDKNVVKVDKVDILKKPKLSPEELEADMKANRGTGAHMTSKKDTGKRRSNPKYNTDFNAY